MIEKFTKLMLSLALLVAGAVGASAEKVYADLSGASAVGNAKWTSETNTFAWTASSYAFMVVPGESFSGDLSSYNTIGLTVSGLENAFRVDILANGKTFTGKSITANGTVILDIFTDFNKQWAADKITVDDLKSVTAVRLNTNSDAGSAVVTNFYIQRPDDPLAVPKDNLSKTIILGKAQSDFAKTAESFQDLTDAIANGEAEYANPEATESSLTEARDAISEAIANLKLSDGYVNLTPAMFHEWTGIGDDATISGAGGCDLKLNSSIANGGMLYGNTSVVWNQYAKLIDAKSLIILGTPNGEEFGVRTDRLEVGNGGGDGNGGSLTQLNMTLTDGMATINLSAKSAVRINAIKKSWSGDAATITDLLVEFKPRTVTVGEAGYTTFAPDMNVRATGVTAYAAKVDGSSVTLTPVDEIPANNAVIIEAATNDYELPVIDSAAAIEDNDLKVSDGTVTGDDIFVLANKNSVVGFYKLGAGVTVPAGKAYLQVEAAGRDFIGFGTETTGIKNVESVKGEGEVYNLKGQRVAAPTKGLYVVDGKKVVLK